MRVKEFRKYIIENMREKNFRRVIIRVTTNDGHSVVSVNTPVIHIYLWAWSRKVNYNYIYLYYLAIHVVIVD